MVDLAALWRRARSRRPVVDGRPGSPPAPPAGEPAAVASEYARYDRLMAQGRAAEAALAMMRAVAHRPDDPIANYRLGLHFSTLRDASAARERFLRAAAAVATIADEWLCRGLALDCLGRSGEAASAFREALALQPGQPDATYQLAILLMRCDRLGEAVDVSRASIAVEGERVISCFSLALALRFQGLTAEAESVLQRVLDLSAGAVGELFDLARQAEAYGLADWAARCSGKALETDPRLEIRLFHDLLLPQVPESEAQIEWWRRRYAAGVAALARSDLRVAEPHRHIQVTPWVWLFFQGRDDRDLSAASVRMHQRLCPALSWTAPHCRPLRRPRLRSRVRVGCFGPSINPFLAGMLRHLDRRYFEVIHLRVPDHVPYDPSTVDRVIDVPDSSLGDARAAIAAEKLDVLVAQPWLPIGHFLTYARLAPVQCAFTDPSWSDGVPAFDYYVSWRRLEPADPARRYNSATALLERPPFWLAGDLCRPAPVSRADFDLPADRRWYVCPHSAPKMHPAYDRVIERVLRGDPDGCVIVLRGDAPVAMLIKSRMRRALGAVADRLLFLPGLPPDRCHGLLQIADAVLDSWPIQGLSSSISALLLGVPLVTRAADVPFGRWTAAMYDSMGIPDLVAGDEDDFVRLAHRVAMDREWRALASSRIRARVPALLEDRLAVRELEGFLRAAVAAARRGAAPRPWRSGRFVGDER